ncbi:MurR/RpiR family transcriptional regulator [Clostridium butyricum]|uniref:MurR/RpiR family transcriptional regulator n=1 Tax=Clostridium butyricum TaxID=1492 RepID=UPI000A1120A3|nr:MurR/RpiR family transcriptional regulator [Clostridium butyricum]
MKFEDRVILNELKFTDTDDQIIEYIRKNKDKVLSQSIQDTAEQLYTVPNTIVRLSRKLGYNGFSELKFELKKEQEGRNSSSQIRFDSEEFISENIVKTMNMVDKEVIKKTIKKNKTIKKYTFAWNGRFYIFL